MLPQKVVWPPQTSWQPSFNMGESPPNLQGANQRGGSLQASEDHTTVRQRFCKKIQMWCGDFCKFLFFCRFACKFLIEHPTCVLKHVSSIMVFNHPLNPWISTLRHWPVVRPNAPQAPAPYSLFNIPKWFNKSNLRVSGRKPIFKVDIHVDMKKDIELRII